MERASAGRVGLAVPPGPAWVAACSTAVSPHSRASPSITPPTRPTAGVGGNGGNGNTATGGIGGARRFSRVRRHRRLRHGRQWRQWRRGRHRPGRRHLRPRRPALTPSKHGSALSRKGTSKASRHRHHQRQPGHGLWGRVREVAEEPPSPAVAAVLTVPRAWPTLGSAGHRRAYRRRGGRRHRHHRHRDHRQHDHHRQPRDDQRQRRAGYLLVLRAASLAWRDMMIPRNPRPPRSRPWVSASLTLAPERGVR